EEEQERIRNNWEFIWHYKTVGFYSKQVEAYLKNFKDVKVVLLNELENNPKTIIQDIYDFLNVDPLFTPKMDIKHNISGLPKNKIIYLLTTQPNRLKSAIRPIVQRLTPPGTRNRVVKRIKLKNIKKVPINSATRQYLINQYHDDILRLQKLINKDLSSWLK
ncbi:MAG: sulfotransferase, partial [Patescibacteria group bacterium]